MGFASAYLEDRALFPEIIKEAPDKNTGIIVVVPARNEPLIDNMLDSLILCSEPLCNVEVIIVVNAPPGEYENNKITLDTVRSWKMKHLNSFFRLFAFEAGLSSASGWGVGVARKTGMDEAVRRFNRINNPDGIILNLDADCRVDRNYFVAVLDEFSKNKNRSACSIYFEHPLSGNEFPGSIYKYIALYELHLRYFLQGLIYAGFPYAFHTVGSAIGVKASKYVKAGGMNRRQAAEDFYFVQKLVPAGGYFNLTETTVYPSPRPSTRVPFGTGATIGRLSERECADLLTYNPAAFDELRSFFSMAEELFFCRPDRLIHCYEHIPEGLRMFTGEKEFTEKLIEIKYNTSGLPSFGKRFFGWFNMFRIIKYLNSVHTDFFGRKPAEISASELLVKKDIVPVSEDPLNLLLQYRSLEKPGTVQLTHGY
jgi:hypothetical protein